MHTGPMCAQDQVEEAAWLAQAQLQSSDLILVANDNTCFPVHRAQLMANSVVFANTHAQLRAVAGNKPKIAVPFNKSEVAIVLPFLYDTPLPPLTSLTFEGVWRAIQFAVTFKIDRFIVAVSAAAGRYSNIPALEPTLVALFVALELKDHGLVNWCFKKIMHLNPNAKVIAVTVDNLIDDGKLVRTPLVNTTTATLMAAAVRRLHTRVLSHHAFHQKLKAHQHTHHSLPQKIRCTCPSAPQIEKLWKHAFAANQHELKKVAMAFKGKSHCEKGAQKALSAFYLHSERMTEVMGVLGISVVV